MYDDNTGCWEGFIGLVLLCLFFWSMFALIKDATKNLVSYQQYYDSKGVAGEHQLAVINPDKTQISGDFSGHASYFLFMGGGSIDGQIQSDSTIQIKWIAPDGMTQFMDVPYYAIKWDFQNKYETPTFEFKFTQAFLNGQVDKNTELNNYNTVFKNADAIIIHTTEAQFYQDVLSKLQK